MNLFGLTIIATSKYDKLYRESNEIGVRLSRCQSDINKLKESFKETVADRDAYMASLKWETDRANAAEEELKEAKEKANTLEKEMAEKDDKLLDMGKALSKERENYLLSVREKEDLKQAVITAEKKAKEEPIPLQHS